MREGFVITDLHANLTGVGSRSGQKSLLQRSIARAEKCQLSAAV